MANIMNADGGDPRPLSEEHRDAVVVRKALLAAWNDRADAHGWECGSRDYVKHQLEFFGQIIAALDAVGAAGIPYELWKD